MIYHAIDENGVFTGSHDAIPGDVPNSFVYPLNGVMAPPPADEPGRWRWSGNGWQAHTPPSPAERRRLEYLTRSDPLLLLKLSYAEEAAHGIEGAAERAEAAGLAFLAEKARIRDKFPDDGAAPPPPPATVPAGGKPYRITRGRIHADTCAHGQNGTPTDANVALERLSGGSATPCRVCNPRLTADMGI